MNEEGTEDRLPIAGGLRLAVALDRFRASVNQRDTIFSTDHWLEPKLDQINQSFSDPITNDEAQALTDVLYGRRWMKDLLEWIAVRPMRWEDFFPYRDRLEAEAKEKKLAELRKKDEEWERKGAGRSTANFLDRPSRKEYMATAKSCPQCGRRPKDLEWYWWSSKPSSWYHLCGRAGWRTRCQKCNLDIDFFVMMLN